MTQGVRALLSAQAESATSLVSRAPGIGIGEAAMSKDDIGIDVTCPKCSAPMREGWAAVLVPANRPGTAWAKQVTLRKDCVAQRDGRRTSG